MSSCIVGSVTGDHEEEGELHEEGRRETMNALPTESQTRLRSSKAAHAISALRLPNPPSTEKRTIRPATHTHTYTREPHAPQTKKTHNEARARTHTSPLPDHCEKKAIAMMIRMRFLFPGVRTRLNHPTSAATSWSSLIAALISSNSYSTSGSCLSPAAPQERVSTAGRSTIEGRMHVRVAVGVVVREGLERLRLPARPREAEHKQLSHTQSETPKNARGLTVLCSRATAATRGRTR